MKTLSRLGTSSVVAIIFGSSGVSLSDEINIVSPSEAEFIEGNQATPHWGSPAPVSVQMLYPAEDFMSLPETHRTITGFAWRQDESSAITDPIFHPGVTVILSTTTADELVPTFADNHGDDQTVVFDHEISGSLVWQDNDTGPGPRDFEFIFPFTTPFIYDPSSGRNLVVQFIDMEEASNDDVLIDQQSTNAITWQADHDLTVSQFARRYVLVTQFTFVPEPLAGDFDEDGDVDGADFLKWQRGEVSNPPSAEDLTLWEDRFGNTSTIATTASIPEPSTLLLSALAAVGLLMRRR